MFPAGFSDAGDVIQSPAPVHAPVVVAAHSAPAATPDPEPEPEQEGAGSVPQVEVQSAGSLVASMHSEAPAVETAVVEHSAVDSEDAEQGRAGELTAPGESKQEQAGEGEGEEEGEGEGAPVAPTAVPAPESLPAPAPAEDDGGDDYSDDGYDDGEFDEDG